MTEKFEIRENRFYSYDVYDNLDRLLPRWLATFKFFKDAKAFTTRPDQDAWEAQRQEDAEQIDLDIAERRKNFDAGWDAKDKADGVTRRDYPVASAHSPSEAGK